MSSMAIWSREESWAIRKFRGENPGGIRESVEPNSVRFFAQKGSYPSGGALLSRKGERCQRTLIDSRSTVGLLLHVIPAVTWRRKTLKWMLMRQRDREQFSAAGGGLLMGGGGGVGKAG